MSGRIELREDGSRARHYLDGRPLRPGDRIEILLAGNRWLRGRYEWNGNLARWPAVRVELGGPWEGDEQTRSRAAVLALHPDATARWSESAARLPSETIQREAIEP